MASLTTIFCVMGIATGRLSDWTKDDLIAPLLLLLLGMVFGIGIICLLLVGHYLRTNRLNDALRHSPMERPESRRRRLYSPQTGLAYPSRWLAIRNGNLRLIQSTLGLQRTSPCSWEEGIHAAQAHRLFISPPVRGWVLVMGGMLPDPTDDVDRCFRLIHLLSGKLGQVQFYSLNRALNHHAWVAADRGGILRAYAWGGQTLWNQGRKTRDEIELSMTCHGYGESGTEFDFSHGSVAELNTEKVAFLAARWSVDPQSIDIRSSAESLGVTGDASLSLG